MTEVAGVAATPSLPPHVVLRDCSVMIGSNMVVLTKGKVLQDHRLITACLEASAPVESIEQANRHVSCPACGNVFEPQPVHISPGELKSLRKTS